MKPKDNHYNIVIILNALAIFFSHTLTATIHNRQSTPTIEEASNAYVIFNNNLPNTIGIYAIPKANPNAPEILVKKIKPHKDFYRLKCDPKYLYSIKELYTVLVTKRNKKTWAITTKKEHRENRLRRQGSNKKTFSDADNGHQIIINNNNVLHKARTYSVHTLRYKGPGSIHQIKEQNNALIITGITIASLAIIALSVIALQPEGVAAGVSTTTAATTAAGSGGISSTTLGIGALSIALDIGGSYGAAAAIHKANKQTGDYIPGLHDAAKNYILFNNQLTHTVRIYRIPRNNPAAKQEYCCSIKSNHTFYRLKCDPAFLYYIKESYTIPVTFIDKKNKLVKTRKRHREHTIKRANSNSDTFSIADNNRQIILNPSKKIKNRHYAVHSLKYKGPGSFIAIKRRNEALITIGMSLATTIILPLAPGADAFIIAGGIGAADIVGAAVSGVIGDEMIAAANKSDGNHNDIKNTPPPQKPPPPNQK